NKEPSVKFMWSSPVSLQLNRMKQDRFLSFCFADGYLDACHLSGRLAAFTPLQPPRQAALSDIWNWMEAGVQLIFADHLKHTSTANALALYSPAISSVGLDHQGHRRTFMST
ncbi:MAG: hypothetical protein WBB65_15805, partial [Anaerolineales bacterium]